MSTGLSTGLTNSAINSRINNLKDFEIKMSNAIIFFGKDDVDLVFWVQR